MHEYQHGRAMSWSHCHLQLSHLQLNHPQQDGLMVAEVAEAKQGSAFLNVGQRRFLFPPSTLSPFLHRRQPMLAAHCWSPHHAH